MRLKFWSLLIIQSVLMWFIWDLFKTSLYIQIYFRHSLEDTMKLWIGLAFPIKNFFPQFCFSFFPKKYSQEILAILVCRLHLSYYFNDCNKNEKINVSEYFSYYSGILSWKHSQMKINMFWKVPSNSYDIWEFKFIILWYY